MADWLINSAVLTAFGEYSYEPLTVEAARELVASGRFESAIGHAVTAQLLADQLGIPVSHNRVAITMQPGDRSIVFRVCDRLPEVTVLSHQQLSAIRTELGLLTRVR